MADLFPKMRSFSAGLQGVPLRIADIAPYLLREPLAPSESAAREGVVIELFRYAKHSNASPSTMISLLLREPVAFWSPWQRDLLVADLVDRAFTSPVDRCTPEPGTVNHTLMTCECARSRGIEIIGVVINGLPASTGPGRRIRAACDI